MSERREEVKDVIYTGKEPFDKCVYFDRIEASIRVLPESISIIGAVKFKASQSMSVISGINSHRSRASITFGTIIG